MLNRIICAIFGHKDGRMLYADEYVSIHECDRCKVPVVEFTIQYHLYEVLNEDGVEEADKVAKEIMKGWK